MKFYFSVQYLLLYFIFIFTSTNIGEEAELLNSYIEGLQCRPSLGHGYSDIDDSVVVFGEQSVEVAPIPIAPESLGTNGLNTELSDTEIESESESNVEFLIREKLEMTEKTFIGIPYYFMPTV